MSIEVTREELSRVLESINFAQEEEKILNYWIEQDTFQQSLKLSKGKPR